MQIFASGREAKEFLVSRIVLEAEHEGVELSDVERKMLYFSEVDWSLPDIMEVNEVFEREYDDAAYEEKIAGLIRSFQKRMRKESHDEYDSWEGAVCVLRREDHYLLVLIGIANGTMTTSDSSGFSTSRFVRLLGYAFLALCLLLLIVMAYAFFKTA